MFKKLVGLIIIILFLGSMTPVNAINPYGNIAAEALESALLQPLNSTEAGNVIIDHLKSKLHNNLNPAHVEKFYEDILFNNLLYGKALGDIDPAVFYASYLNYSDEKFNFHGAQLTAREAAGRVTAIGTYLKNLDKEEDKLAGMSKQDQLDFILHEYPDINTIDKNIRGWNDVAKINWVLTHTEMDQDALNDHPNGISTKTAWTNYAARANNTINNYARSFWNAGILYDQEFGKDSGNDIINESTVKSSVIKENIETLNNTATYIDSTRKTLQDARISSSAIGWFCLITGVTLMGQGIAEYKKTGVSVDKDGIPIIKEPEPLIIEDGTVIGDQAIDGGIIGENPSPSSQQVLKIAAVDPQKRLDTTGIDPKNAIHLDGMNLERCGFRDLRGAVDYLIDNGQVADGPPIRDIVQGKVALESQQPVNVVARALNGQLFRMKLSFEAVGRYGEYQMKFTTGKPGYANYCMVLTHPFKPSINTYSFYIKVAQYGYKPFSIRSSVDGHIPAGNISFEQANNSMGPNDCLVIDDKQGNMLIINKAGMNSEDLDEVGVKGTDFFDNGLLFDSEYVQYENEYGGFTPKEIKDSQTIWISAITATGGFAASIALGRLIVKLIDVFPGVGIFLAIVGAIIAAIGVILIVLGEVLLQVINILSDVISNILEMLRQLVGFYNFLYAPYQH